MNKKFKNLTGERFGKLLVLKREENYKRPFWLCKCDCGNTTITSSNHLLSGQTRSCGCLKNHNLLGKKFGRWLVIGKIKENKKLLWLCQCECGNIGKVNSFSLLQGKSKSCGCLQKEITKKRLTTHNQTNKRIYNIYYNIKQRCYNKKEKRYKDYGGRGITICDEWLGDNGFVNFYNWSIKNGYQDDLTIDRIDNNGNYEPSNCRWTNLETQTNNKRNTIYFEFFGIKKSLKQWINFMGWNYKTYYARYSRGYETFRINEIIKIEEKLKGEKKNE